MHAHYHPGDDGASPMARVRGFVDAVRRENPWTIFTGGGDDYEKGSIAEGLSRGRATRQVVQAMRYDLRTIGNHDFAWGLEELMAFSHDDAAVVLAANTHWDGRPATGQEPGWVEYAQVTVGCVRIGFFGLVTRPWNERGEQYDGPYLPDCPGLRSDFNHAAIVREIVRRHRREVDLLVLVSHLGIHDDIRLAQEVAGIDLILGGHSHTTMTQPQWVGDTMIVHTGAHAEHLGRLDLDFDLEAGRVSASRFTLVANEPGVVPVNRVVNREIAAILAPCQEAIEGDFARLESPRSREEMARIAALAAMRVLGADAVLVNPRSAWRQGRPGNLTRQDIFEIFPAVREPAGTPGVSSLYLLQVTGADLVQVRAMLPDFAYAGPARIEDATIYTIALPKTQAGWQQRFFGRGVGLAPPTPAGELWELMVRFAHEQNRDQLALDQEPRDGRRGLFARLSGKSHLENELPMNRMRRSSKLP